jgi:hypothetical protein
VPWPTPQEYNEAIQNPKLSFRDAELADGEPELTALGLPRPITGNFASVYRMRCARRDWAVRCFWREYADMRLRYAAISKHLGEARLPYTVGFDYLDQGIRLGKHWYPVLKMEWVEGELLNAYVERNLSNSRAIADLAERWLVMVSRLEGSGSAHGDLQHGNVLVVSGELKLVDYDAMFVPALSGRGSHEIGHQNYQHPRRTGSDYDAWLDRFSAWVIYISLVALASDSGLWKLLSAGEEALLFRKDDFCRPAESPALRVLSQHADGRVRRLADEFRAYVLCEPSRMPSLEAALGCSQRLSANRAMAPSRLRLAWRSVLPAAPALAVAGYPLSAGSAVGASSASAGRARQGAPAETALLPGWLQDHLPAAQPVCESFGESVLAPRLACTVSAASVAVIGVPLLLDGIPIAVILATGAPLVLLINFICLLVFFRREAAVGNMQCIIRKESGRLRAIKRLERSIMQLEQKRTESTQRYTTRRHQAVRDRTALEERELRDRAEARSFRDAALALIDDRLREIDEQEHAALARALERARMEHVRAQLRASLVGSGEVPGLTTPARIRLRMSGVRTAADLTAERIRTIQWLGPKTLLALATWRVACEREARRVAPRRLTKDERQRVSAPYTLRRDRLQAERSASVRRAERLDATITTRYARRYEPNSTRLGEIDRCLRETEEEIALRLQELIKAQAAELRQLMVIRSELEPYQEVTFRRYVKIVGGLTAYRG